jgi:hypothetical protein
VAALVVGVWEAAGELNKESRGCQREGVFYKKMIRKANGGRANTLK